jgi:hypothetical protein
MLSMEVAEVAQRKKKILNCFERLFLRSKFRLGRNKYCEAQFFEGTITSISYERSLSFGMKYKNEEDSHPIILHSMICDYIKASIFNITKNKMVTTKRRIVKPPINKTVGIRNDLLLYYNSKWTPLCNIVPINILKIEKCHFEEWENNKKKINKTLENKVI